MDLSKECSFRKSEL